jgi:hypothetical protein
MVVKHKHNLLKDKFCRCIKAVSKTVKLRNNSNSKKAGSKSVTKKAATKKLENKKEAAAIAICVNSVLKTRGKTLRKFSCGSYPKNHRLIVKKL